MSRIASGEQTAVERAEMSTLTRGLGWIDVAIQYQFERASEWS